MKVYELIKIIEDKLPNNVNFSALQAGSKWGDTTIFIRDDKICYWDEATTHFLIYDEASKYKVTIKQWCDHNFRTNGVVATLARVMALAEILYLAGGGNYAADDIAGSYDKYVDKKLLQNLNKDIEDKMLKEYDCSQISEMKTLIDLLKNDQLYKELGFSCTFYECKKGELYGTYQGKKAVEEKIKLEFGNLKYADRDSDYVMITAYDDWVELWHNGTGQRAEKEFRLYNLSNCTPFSKTQKREQQIIAALDAWKLYYLN